MSSGLPINTTSQAAEYRKRYLATLALEAQNDAYNLQANQVYRQTGQPSRPPDTRTTTEKMADIEKLKVDLRSGLKAITDGIMANETVEQLSTDEIMFAIQQLPTIVADIKPKFSQGIPAQALLSYIRALRRKNLQTNGVSFTAQEATAQQILNAVQAGMANLGAAGGPFAPNVTPPIPSAPQTPIQPPSPFPETPTEIPPFTPLPSVRDATLRDPSIQESSIQETASGVPGIWSELSAEPAPEITGIISAQNLMDRLGRYGQGGDKKLKQDIRVFLVENDLYKDLININNGKKIGWRLINFKRIPAKRDKGEVEIEETNLLDLIRQVKGRGLGSKDKNVYRTLPIQIDLENTPKSYREILGYGLRIPQRKKEIQIDMTKGLNYESKPTYIPFGKYIINPSKLSSGIFEMKTMKGGSVAKYGVKKLSPKLTKIINRIVGGRMPDDYDFNEMDLDDQTFLYNLAQDSKITDRLKLPTPKRTKDGEEENKFEILKGQICAGNDNKELVKEFKTMLVRFSNDGRIKKNEAREILLDLVAMGY